jgi:hypothetical protein
MKRDLYGELMGRALNRSAPPGHFAAYIRPDESEVLRSMGGGVAPDGGQNMYNGMPAYFEGYGGGYGSASASTYGGPGPSAPSVDAPSISVPTGIAAAAIQAQNNALAAAAGPQGNSGVRGDNPTTVAQEFAIAQAQAEAQAQAQDQAQANIRSGGIAAAAEQAKSQGIADILAAQTANTNSLLAGTGSKGIADILADQTIADDIAERQSVGSMYDPSKVGKGPNTRTGEYFDKDESGRTVTRSIYDSGERGKPGQTRTGPDGITRSASNTSYPGGSPYAFTVPTIEAQLEQADVDKANNSFFGRMSPGDITVVQDPYTGMVSRGRSGTAADIGMGAASSFLPTWLSAILGGANLMTPAAKGEVTFDADLTPLAGEGGTYNDDFNVDDIGLPSISDEELKRLTQSTDPTDPADDPAPPAVKEYYKPPQWVLDRLAQNLAYGKSRTG